MVENFGQILPEHSVPLHLTETQLLELNEHTSARLIWGEGNPGAPVFIILDNPGARETKTGEPFLCGTRRTLQKGLLEAGITLNALYVTFLLKARPLKKYDKERARTKSFNYLLAQIKEHNPKIVFCLGTVVVQAYFQNPELSVKELRGVSHTRHGFKTIVSYHPLAARRRPIIYQYFLEDCRLLHNELQVVQSILH